jgi:hypothetical protein
MINPELSKTSNTHPLDCYLEKGCFFKKLFAANARDTGIGTYTVCSL